MSDQLEQIRQAVLDAWGLQLPAADESHLLISYNSHDGIKYGKAFAPSASGALLSEAEAIRWAQEVGMVLAYSLASTGDTAEAVECAGSLDRLNAEVGRCREALEAPSRRLAA